MGDRERELRFFPPHSPCHDDPQMQPHPDASLGQPIFTAELDPGQTRERTRESREVLTTRSLTTAAVPTAHIRRSIHGQAIHHTSGSLSNADYKGVRAFGIVHATAATVAGEQAYESSPSHERKTRGQFGGEYRGKSEMLEKSCMFTNETNNAEHDHRGFKSRHSPRQRPLQHNGLLHCGVDSAPTFVGATADRSSTASHTRRARECCGSVPRTSSASSSRRPRAPTPSQLP